MKQIVLTLLLMFAVPFTLLPANIDIDKGIETNPVKITILYDNVVFDKNTKSDWGFACLIEGTEETILFDTGTNPEILLHNVNQLNVDLNKIDKIILSHKHHDHTGGLAAILEKNHHATVYPLKSFPQNILETTKNNRVINVDKPLKICKHVYSTGEMGISIKEQSLFINTTNGLVVITGCSHPGIVNIIKKVRTLIDKDIDLVLGGFHLRSFTDEQVVNIINDLKKRGVHRCGATHCTGEKQIELFRKAFGPQFVEMGTGKIIRIN